MKKNEEGRQKGLKEGHEQGIKEGIEVGRLEKQKEIVKNMIDKNLSDDLIMQSLNINCKELQKLKTNIISTSLLVLFCCIISDR